MQKINNNIDQYINWNDPDSIENYCPEDQFEYVPDDPMNDKEFIEQVYEIAFGDNAINRDFSHEEVIDALKEINEDSVKWLDREG